MADPVRTAEALKKLGVCDLQKDWVDGVWEQDFTETPILPPALEQDVVDTHHYSKRLQVALDVCTPWARIDFTTLPQGFWSVLSDNEISPRSLMALVHYFIASVDKLLSPATQREAGIRAAQLYFTLNEIPGSGAYKLFHPLLFQEAVDVLKMWPAADGGKRKRQQSGSQASSSQASQSSRRSNKTRRVDSPGKERSAGGTNEVQMFDEEEDEDEIVTLSPSEIRHIQRDILSAIKGLVFLLRNFSLKDVEQSSQHALQVLAQLSRLPGCQQDHGICLDTSVNLSVVDSLQDLSFLGLQAMCSGSHGDISRMLTMTFKFLMPNLLMFLGENEAVAMSTIPKAAQIAKENARQFVCFMAKELGEHALASVRVLLQHLCVKVPDKIEYRTHTANTVASILSQVPADCHARFMQWVFKYSKNVKTSYRVFAIELCTVLLEQPEREANENTLAECKQFLTHKFLLQLLLSRCSDRAPTVRARSIACFAQFTSSSNIVIQRAVMELFFPSQQMTTPAPILNILQISSAEGGKNDASADQNKEDSTSAKETDDSAAVASAMPARLAADLKKGATPGNLMGGSPALLVDVSGSSPTEGQGILAMLERRACDEKVGVRKAALQALENVLRLNTGALNPTMLKVLHDRCLDPALSVRKQAMNSLTLLLTENPESRELQKTWLDGVLPVVLDREMSAQEKCLETLREVFLSQIVPSNRSTSSKHKLAWDLLHELSLPESRELRSYLQKACQLWSRQKVITPNLVKALTTHLDSQHAQAAWMLLTEAAPSCNLFDPSIITDAWRRYTNEGADTSAVTMQRILSVLGSINSRLDDDIRMELIGDFKDRLLKFDSCTEIVGSMVSAMSKLCLSIGGEDNEEGQKKLDEIAGEILKACDTYLSDMVLTESPSQLVVCEVTLICYLFTLGELAMLCPEKTPKRLLVVVQSLLAGPSAIDGGELPSTQASQYSSQTQVPLSQLSGGILSNTVRAHTFVTLGKMCLQEEGLAKRCIAALARELETSKDPAVRNNVTVVMCDLCIRYPNVVDRYIPNMAACLKDESPLVRRQTLTLLTHLLLEDYVKWRGILFFRFITALVDDDQDIQKFADFCLVELLLKRHPTMLFQHFVECVFHFNTYENSKVYNQFTQSDREKTMFSMKGSAQTAKRQKIYRFMLQHMTDEQRFQLTAKLSQEVLGAVVDNILPMNEDTSALLQDTLAILCCKEIKLSSMRTKAVNEAADEMEMAEAVMAQAKSKLLTAVVKKNTIENIIPVIVSLKYQLEKHHSPVLRDLMLYLKEVMKDYRNEVKDILSADRQLASEIEFDLRRFDEQQAEAAKQKEEAAAVASAAATASAVNATKPATPNRIPCLLSPKAVANCSPKILPSPRLRAPGSPRQPGTPSVHVPKPTRVVSLATQAIVNSVRKTLASVQVNQPQSPRTPGSPKGQRSPRVQGTPKVTFKQEPMESDDSGSLQENSRESIRRGKLSRHYRAISTPDKTIADITFMAGAGDVSAIIDISSPTVPSSMPIRVYSDANPKEVSGTPSWMPQLDEEEEKQKDVVVMFSPEHPTPKPRQWNITSPSRRRDKGANRRGRIKPILQSSESENDEVIGEPPARSSRTSSRTKKTDTPTNDDRTEVPSSPATRSSGRTRKRSTQAGDGEFEVPSSPTTRPARTSSRTRKISSQSSGSESSPSTGSRRSSARLSRSSDEPVQRRSGRMKRK